MRRKAHGERFSLRGERRSLLGKTKLGGGDRLSLRGERRSLRGEWRNSRAAGQNHARKGKVCSGKCKTRAAGKAPPFEFLPLLSTCPLGGHATPWVTAPWISAPLASLFLDFFHPLNSCHLLVLHSFTPAYWVSDYPFFDSRHCRF